MSLKSSLVGSSFAVVALLAGACAEAPSPTGPDSGARRFPHVSANAAGNGSRVLLYATGKIPSRIVSVVDITDLDAMSLVDWGLSRSILGHDAHGVDVDASGNVIFVKGWSEQPRLVLTDPALTIIGETAITDASPGDVAFRPDGQAVACSAQPRGSPARLFVFDVTDPANPVQLGASDVPGTGTYGECRGIALDEQGDVWVATGADGNLVKISLDVAGAPTSTHVFRLPYPWGAVSLAIQPGTHRVFLSLINAGYIGVVDLADPTVSVALITDVCESAAGSPQGLHFSPAGHLFAGCSNYYGATHDLVAIPASSLTGLTGTVSATALGLRGADLGPPGVVGADGTMGYLAIGPAPPDGQGPVASQILADPNPVMVNAALTLTALVDDAGTGGSVVTAADYRLAGLTGWNSMTAVDASFDGVSEAVTAALPPFTSPAVVDACVRGTDAAGNTGAEACTMLAVFDPTGGFATGAGWIDSEAGAYFPDPTLTGKAHFAFVSKYQKGAGVPDGNASFRFRVADLDFQSTSYEWLVVSQGGTNAQFKGRGRINDQPSPSGEDYRFMIWATDDGPDTFRIKIWDEAGVEQVFYDNGFDQPIGAGQIKVHK